MASGSSETSLLAFSVPALLVLWLPSLAFTRNRRAATLWRHCWAHSFFYSSSVWCAGHRDSGKSHQAHRHLRLAGGGVPGFGGKIARQRPAYQATQSNTVPWQASHGHSTERRVARMALQAMFSWLVRTRLQLALADKKSAGRTWPCRRAWGVSPTLDAS